MARENKAVKAERIRTAEQYILTQFNYHYASESFRDHKDRMERGDMLYIGDLSGLFPNEQNLPEIPYVENKFKNALHDITRLAREGRGAVKFRAQGDKDKDLKLARVREAICEGYYGFNKFYRNEANLYMDIIGAGHMATAIYYDENQKGMYPTIRRLNPRFGFPDVYDNRLQSYLSAEAVKERLIANAFPHLGLNGSADNSRDAYLTCLYDDKAITEAVLFTSGRDGAGAPTSATVTRMWEHGLGCVPVAFEMLSTYDGKFHGLFEQLGGPLMVRNQIVKFMVDYLESIVHAPIVAEGVLNADDTPGPDVIYQLDPNAERTSMGRLAPAAPAPTVFGMLQYMQDQEEKEAIQPPARAGQVSQSIASGSFVDRTQGQLSSIVKEVEEKMAWLREQQNELCMKVDETHMDFSKPLYTPVAGKNEYTPSEHIKGWYFHEVKYGAGAGLDRLNSDTRVLNHLGARLISRETARGQIDYLEDMADEQDKIDRENLADALLQRLVADPTTPMHVVAQAMVDMQKQGSTLVEAMEKAAPQLIAAAQAQQQAQPGALPEGAEPPVPGEEIPAGGPTPAEQELLDIASQSPPLLQLFNRNR